jgi:hypothetical protein
MTMTAANGRDRSGRFLTGNKAGPGRPLGSRNKLAQRFLEDVFKQWKKHGVEVLERVIHDDPTAFMKVVATILPKEIDSTLSMNLSVFHEVEDFNEAFEFALRHIGSNMPRLIDADTADEAINADDRQSTN